MKHLLSLSRESWKDYFISIGEKSFKATQVIEWIYDKKVFNSLNWSNFKNETREIIQKEFNIDKVICDIYPGEEYEIEDTDVFGVGDRDPIYRVYGAKDRTHNKDIRIDMQNYPVWNVLQ